MERRITRRRWRQEVYEAAQQVLDDDPTISARGISDALAKIDDQAPQESTIRDWLRKGVIVRRSPGDYWSVTTADAEEAHVVVPALAFLVTKGRKLPRLTIRRARWIAKLRTIDPAMPIGAAVVLARLYEAHEDDGIDPALVDRYLAMSVDSGWCDWPGDGSQPPIDTVWLTEAGRKALHG